MEKKCVETKHTFEMFELNDPINSSECKYVGFSSLEITSLCINNQMKCINIAMKCQQLLVIVCYQ